MLPSRRRRAHAVRHELDALVLDVVVRRALKDGDLVGRYAVDAADLFARHLFQIEELRILVGDADGLIFHAVFEDGDLLLIFSAVRLPPALREVPTRGVVFEFPGIVQDSARPRAVQEESAELVIHCQAIADDLAL